MKVNGDVGIWDGVIHIFNDTKAMTIYLAANGTEDDKRITLNDCLKLIEHEKGVCYVIFDSATHGEIYEYGNYADKSWHTYGTTIGYA